VLRDTTERPEGVEAGCAQLVGTNSDDITRAALRLLTDERQYAKMSNAGNLYGDGTAGTRIASILRETLHTSTSLNSVEMATSTMAQLHHQSLKEVFV
jgi:UDP-N-acetylglucosamine 2-epimerase (non-hydrolysing)